MNPDEGIAQQRFDAHRIGVPRQWQRMKSLQ